MCDFFVQKDSDYYDKVTYAYSFGDSDTSPSGGNTVSTATHSYRRPGHYTAQVS